MTTEQYKDKIWLREQYVENSRSIGDIADEFDTGNGTISYWLDKFDIETRAANKDRDDPWRREDALRELYVDEELPLREVAERLGCSATTVARWLDRHDIERRSRGWGSRTNYVGVYLNYAGYEQAWSNDYQGGKDAVMIHRLVMVAELGFDEVTRDMDVHHKNGIPWDNRPENLELLPHDEHRRLHNESGDGNRGDA